VEPTPTVTVRPSGATVGPSTPESDGGAPMPAGGGVPPAVRNLARAVIVRNRSVSSARPSAVALNEITAVCRCACGRIPAWYRPWNGTGGSAPAWARSSACWLAGVGWVAR
jgi:hypothetical protein